MATSTEEKTPAGRATMPKKGKIRRFLARPVVRRERAWGPLASLGVAEDAIQFVVAAVLVLIAAVVLVQSITQFFSENGTFATRISDVTNGILYVIIILEILTTVVAHFDLGGFQLKPFLIIGIISAVRHILTVGAQESLAAADSATAFRRAQVELGVNAGVVLALVVGLILVRKTDMDDNQAADIE